MSTLTHITKKSHSVITFKPSYSNDNNSKNWLLFFVTMKFSLWQSDLLFISLSGGRSPIKKIIGPYQYKNILSDTYTHAHTHCIKSWLVRQWRGNNSVWYVTETCQLNISTCIWYYKVHLYLIHIFPLHLFHSQAFIPVLYMQPNKKK